MSDFDRAMRIVRTFEQELEGEGDIHGAALVAVLRERIESEVTEEADYECSCEDDPDLCPFHGAPL
jgi:hypothetical protein